MLTDFNLLRHLHALLNERNVSRAAEKMAMTQSAMSRSLARLREQLQDPLMVRINNQYTLTERAINLKIELDQLIPQLSQFGVPESLDLASIEREVHLAGTDLDILYVEKGIKKIQQMAPNLRLSIRSNSLRMIDDLITGEIDFLMTAIEDQRSGLYRRRVAKDDYVAVTGMDNKLTAKNLNIDSYLQHRHGMFAFAEKSRVKVDDALAKLGKKRQVTLSLPSFSQIPPFLDDGQLIFSVPRGFANHLDKHLAIKILPLPFKVKPLEIYLYWHERHQSSHLHQWFKNCLLT
jgi:LysR family transcriptional regulator, nod-box dependent transcriptional activator